MSRRDLYWESRDDVAECVDDALEFQRRTVTADERERIIDYSFTHKAASFHAIARVLGTCCHCVYCLNGGKTKRPS